MLKEADYIIDFWTFLMNFSYRIKVFIVLPLIRVCKIPSIRPQKKQKRKEKMERRRNRRRIQKVSGGGLANRLFTIAKC